MERINIAMRDAELWLAFRMACLKRRKSASQAIVEMIREQLERWKQEEEQHAKPRRRSPRGR